MESSDLLDLRSEIDSNFELKIARFAQTKFRAMIWINKSGDRRRIEGHPEEDACQANSERLLSAWLLTMADCIKTAVLINDRD